MSAFSDALAALQASLDGVVPALANATNRKVTSAAQADNALALNGQSASQLTSTAAAHTDAHANRSDNPHGTTALQVGAYPSTTVDQMVAALIPSGILPLSTFGNINGDVVDFININGSTGVGTFTAGIPLIMSGQFFSLGALTFNCTKGATTKVYMQLVGGVPTVVTSATAIPETPTNMYIGSVTIDGSGNVTNGIVHVVRFDNYRISTTAIGSAIPVSNGTPDTTSHLLWT